MRLAASFLTALLLTLAVWAGQGRGPAASQVQTAAVAVAVADKAAADPSPCHVFADTEPAPAPGASEAQDTHPEVEDSTEVLATGPLALSPMARSQAWAAMSAHAAPSPWLDGLLRPPRTLNG